MSKESVIICLLALVIGSSLALAYFSYSENLELRGRLSETQRELEELRGSLEEAERSLAEAQIELSNAERELLRSREEISSLLLNLSTLQEELSSCLKGLSEAKNMTKLNESKSSCESELSACRSRLYLLERPSVRVVHWWYESIGCAPCGTASARFHVVLFNAGYETASNVRVTIVLYDRSNNPMDSIRVEVGSLSGRTGKVVERDVPLPAGFQRADVRCEWG